MDTNEGLKEWLKSQHPDTYRLLIELEKANKEAMQLPKDSIILRLEALGFRRDAVNAVSDTHFCVTPCDKKGEYSLVVQIGDGAYDRYGERSISYDQGVDVQKSCGQILKEGFYTLEEFDQLLDRMEGSHWYREKMMQKRLPVLTLLQRMVYDRLPLSFSWSEGKEIAVKTGMPARTAQRFFGNRTMFHKFKSGTYAKKIIFTQR